VENNKSIVKQEKGTLRPFVSFPPDPKIIPTNPILLDIVRVLSLTYSATQNWSILTSAAKSKKKSKRLSSLKKRQGSSPNLISGVVNKIFEVFS
jgi:hypothetical protein